MNDKEKERINPLKALREEKRIKDEKIKKRKEEEEKKEEEERRRLDFLDKEKEQEINKRREEAKKERLNIKLTTAFNFSNYKIEDEIGVVTAECVYGMNIFRDFFADIRDFFGGRSKASQKVLRDARNTCLDELKIEAHALGADGIMGIDLDYSEISGGGKGMLLLVASGTAVKLKRKF